MAMSSVPDCGRLDPSSSKETSSLSDIMAGMTTKDPEGSSANGVKNGKGQQDVNQGKRVQVLRPHLSGRKLSLQERGTYLSAGSEGGYTHISPHGARRPTVESKRVSISDSQVRLFIFLFILSEWKMSQVCYMSMSDMRFSIVLPQSNVGLTYSNLFAVGCLKRPFMLFLYILYQNVT